MFIATQFLAVLTLRKTQVNEEDKNKVTWEQQPNQRT